MVTKSNKCTPQNGSFSEALGILQVKKTVFIQTSPSFSLLPCFFHLDRPRFFGLLLYFLFTNRFRTVHSKLIPLRPTTNPCMIHQGAMYQHLTMIRLSTLKAPPFLYIKCTETACVAFFFCLGQIVVTAKTA